MSETYDVKITVKEITKNKCNQGHKVGDSWIYGGKNTALTPGGLCADAYCVLAPIANVLRFGGEFPWTREDKDVLLTSCPDPNVQVIYEIRRLR